MTALRADARLAWSLLRGSPRGEWWRLGLTAAGTALGTVFALAATVVAVIGTRFGGGAPRYTNNLLNHSGLRPGVITALLLLILPALALVGQCTRIGAARRERRLAALRLAGATPGQVRRIVALETGTIGAAGTVLGLAAFMVLRAVAGAAWTGEGPRTWPTDVPVPWAAAVAVVLGVPLLATLGAWSALRRANADPLDSAGYGRRPRAAGTVRLLLGPLALLGAVGLGTVTLVAGPDSTSSLPMSVAVLVLVVFGLLQSTAALAMLTGRLAARSGRPALLIAGERLRADPWAAARAHTAVMLAALVASAWVAMRTMTVRALTTDPDYRLTDPTFYIGGYDLAGLALLIGVAVTVTGLAVGVVESVTTRRRTLASLAAAGTPRGVLGRALLLETALPLAPAVLLGGLCGLGVAVPVGIGMGQALPLLEPVLITGGLLAGTLLATAASLPLLRRTVHPAQLRYE